MKAAVVSLDVSELDALLARIEPVIAKLDHERLKSLVSTLIAVTRLARSCGATIARLRRMLGQTSSEKTANVIGANGGAAATASNGGVMLAEALGGSRARVYHLGTPSYPLLPKAHA